MSRIIPRKEWGARYGAGWTKRPMPTPAAYLHHTTTVQPPIGATFDQDAAAVRQLDQIGYDLFRGSGGEKAGISYTYVIAPSGRIFAGHDADREGSHTRGHNRTAVGIALIGTFTREAPTQAQLDGCAWLLRELHATGVIANPALTGGHRDTSATECPGSKAYPLIRQINTAAKENPVSKSKNGWPTLSRVPASTFTAPNGKTVYVANADVATVFKYIADQWHRRIEPIPKATHNVGDPAVRTGFIVIHAYRPPGAKVGIGDASNHRSATGMDINGHLHPYERTAPKPYRDGFTQAQRDTLRAIAREVADDNGRTIIRLGIDFQNGWRDGMHVELAPNVSTTRLRQAANRIRRLTGGTPNPAPGNTLRRGDRGSAVKAWQGDLRKVGYKLTADGVFGNDTDRDTKAFQRKHKLTVDGIVGANTRAAMAKALKPAPKPTPKPNPKAPTLRSGSKGAAVKSLQDGLLRVFPDYAGPIRTSGGADGSFGPGTQRVVIEFQRRSNLTPDGVVGAKTWAALAKHGITP